VTLEIGDNLSTLIFLLALLAVFAFLIWRVTK
jgi:preprotein translocase subunit YajC